MMNELEQIEKIFEMVRRSAEISEASKLYGESKELLKQYERTAAISQIQKIIDQYKLEIDLYGALQGVRVVSGRDYSQYWDTDIMAHLLYLTRNILIYECLKQGKQELAKAVVKSIEKNEKEFDL